MAFSALVQNNAVPSDKTSQLGLSNGQIFLQKADGWFQLYSRQAYTTSRRS
jgi:hypothetical protein